MNDARDPSLVELLSIPLRARASTKGIKFFAKCMIVIVILTLLKCNVISTRAHKAKPSNVDQVE